MEEANLRVAVRVISLDDADMRRAQMVSQLQPLGLDWSFFDACRSGPADIPYDPARARRKHGRELTRGELGCFASHRALWHWISESPDYDMICVMEDDLIIDPVFFGRLNEIAAAAAPFAYLRLYAKVPAGIRREGAFLGRHIVRFSGRAYGTQGYLLSKAGAAKFLASITKVERPVDDEMDRFWAHGLPIRAIFPFPVMETDVGSTIEHARRVSAKLELRERAEWTLTKGFEKLRRLLAIRASGRL